MQQATKRRLALDASFFVCCGRGVLLEDEDADLDASRCLSSHAGDHGRRPRPTDALAREEAATTESQVASEVSMETQQTADVVSSLETHATSPTTVSTQRLPPMSLYRLLPSPYQVPQPPVFPYITESISRRYAILRHRDNMREQRERLKMTAHDTLLL